MTSFVLRPLAAAAIVLGLSAGCGSEAAPPAGQAPAPTTSSSVPGPTTVVVKPPPVTLGPEWTVSEGRVRIEATASGDARALLRDLEALGLRDGVAFGRVVNGWLPVESFDRAQRLSSLQLVRPTGAGTG